MSKQDYSLKENYLLEYLKISELENLKIRIKLSDSVIESNVIGDIFFKISELQPTDLIIIDASKMLMGKYLTKTHLKNIKTLLIGHNPSHLLDKYFNERCDSNKSMMKYAFYELLKMLCLTEFVNYIEKKIRFDPTKHAKSDDLILDNYLKDNDMLSLINFLNSKFRSLEGVKKIKELFLSRNELENYMFLVYDLLIRKNYYYYSKSDGEWIYDLYEDMFDHREFMKYTKDNIVLTSNELLINKRTNFEFEEGEYTIVTRKVFEERFEAFTENIFDGFNWDNVALAGGMLTLLLSSKIEDYTNYKYSDIDLFVYGLRSKEEKINKFKYLLQYFQSRFETVFYLVSEFQKRFNLVTLVIPGYSRNIQIIMTNRSRPEEVVNNFDSTYINMYYKDGKVMAGLDAIYSWKNMCTYYKNRIIHGKGFLRSARIYKAMTRGFDIYINCNGFRRQKIRLGLDKINGVMLTDELINKIKENTDESQYQKIAEGLTTATTGDLKAVDHNGEYIYLCVLKMNVNLNYRDYFTVGGIRDHDFNDKNVNYYKEKFMLLTNDDLVNEGIDVLKERMSNVFNVKIENVKMTYKDTITILESSPLEGLTPVDFIKFYEVTKTKTKRYNHKMSHSISKYATLKEHQIVLNNYSFDDIFSYVDFLYKVSTYNKRILVKTPVLYKIRMPFIKNDGHECEHKYHPMVCDHFHTSKYNFGKISLIFSKEIEDHLKFYFFLMKLQTDLINAFFNARPDCKDYTVKPFLRNWDEYSNFYSVEITLPKQERETSVYIMDMLKGNIDKIKKMKLTIDLIVKGIMIANESIYFRLQLSKIITRA